MARLPKKAVKVTSCSVRLKGGFGVPGGSGYYSSPSLGYGLLLRGSSKEACLEAMVELSSIAEAPLAIISKGQIPKRWGQWSSPKEPACSVGGYVVVPTQEAYPHEYMLASWFGAEIPLKWLSEVFEGVATPLGVDTSMVKEATRQCPYLLSLVTDGGCANSCPTGIRDCLRAHLTGAELLTAPRDGLPPQARWFRGFTQSRHNRVIDNLRKRLTRKGSWDTFNFVSAVYLKGGFELDVYPLPFQVYWDKEEETRALHAKARDRAQASREYKKAHCDACLLSCPSWKRARCGGTLTSAVIREIILEKVASQSLVPATTSWNNRTIQAGLALGGLVFKGKLEEYACARRYRVVKVHSPSRGVIWRRRGRYSTWGSTERPKEPLVRVCLDWGNYPEMDVTLSELLKASPDCADRMRSWKPVGLTRKQIEIYLYLTTLDGLKHSSSGPVHPFSGVSLPIVGVSGKTLPLVVYFGKRHLSRVDISTYTDLHMPYHGIDLYGENSRRNDWRKNF